jgi:hypothetical protein
MLHQSWREMSGFDVVPWAVVVGSAVPHTAPRGVIIVVDVEEAIWHPDCHIKSEFLRVEEERRVRKTD